MRVGLRYPAITYRSVHQFSCPQFGVGFSLTAGIPPTLPHPCPPAGAQEPPLALQCGAWATIYELRPYCSSCPAQPGIQGSPRGVSEGGDAGAGGAVNGESAPSLICQRVRGGLSLGRAPPPLPPPPPLPHSLDAWQWWRCLGLSVANLLCWCVLGVGAEGWK